LKFGNGSLWRRFLHRECSGAKSLCIQIIQTIESFFRGSTMRFELCQWGSFRTTDCQQYLKFVFFLFQTVDRSNWWEDDRTWLIHHPSIPSERFSHDFLDLQQIGAGSITRVCMPYWMCNNILAHCAHQKICIEPFWSPHLPENLADRPILVTEPIEIKLFKRRRLPSRFTFSILWQLWNV
jgi:hypothetical protein